jgi:DNA-binding beta-propeller fold protein YncE
MSGVARKLMMAAGAERDFAFDIGVAYYDPPSGTWDIGTAAQASDGISVTTEVTVPSGVHFKPDGTKMYAIGTSDTVHEYDLSTPWVVGTISPVQGFSVAAQEAVPTDLFFKPDGTKMYVVGTAGDDVNEYNLSTAWNISTATYNQNYVLNSTQPEAIYFRSDGLKMYTLADTGDKVEEYTLSTAWDVSTASYVQLFGVGSQEAAPTGLSFKSDGTRMYVIGSNSDDLHEYNLSTAWDISSAIFSKTFADIPDTSPEGIYFKDDGQAFFFVGATTRDVFRFTLGGFSVSAQGTGPQGMSFKTDGTKMYVTGVISDSVHEYDLSIAWDTSTATFNQSFSVAAQDLQPFDVFFKPDGTKMYVSGGTNDSVYEYDLSIAWDTSTATFNQSFSVTSQETAPRGLFFKTDGTKMYVVGDGSGAVNEYSLSTAWNISTASYSQNFSVVTEAPTPSSVFFSPEGRKMFVACQNTNTINEYRLTTVWDVSTASYEQNFYVVEDDNPVDAVFKDDGLKMFILGSRGNSVYTYTLGIQP